MVIAATEFLLGTIKLLRSWLLSWVGGNNFMAFAIIHDDCIIFKDL